MPLKKGEIESKLLSKFGFQWVESSGRGSHERLAFYHEGRKIATTGFSRGFRKNEDLDDSLCKVMAREVRVQTLNFFKGMINCPNSLDDYRNRLREQGYISRE